MFSEKTKLAAAVYQDQPLKNNEADHYIARANGGTDDVTNCHIIPRETNRSKGAKQIQLRVWQAEFVRQWDSSQKGSFLCVAIPGAGKTVAALTVARQFLDQGSDRRLLIVVPTLNLREQWQREAATFAIQLQTKEFGADFKGDWRGGVTTYQSLDALAQLFRLMCAQNRVLVILDEPHHCGDQARWGSLTKTAFESCARRLLLSGTPFRTDGTPIPFVEYDGGGFCLPDFRYDYPNALRDYVVRTFNFDYSRGSYEEVLATGERVTHEFHGDITEDEASFRLRNILNPTGQFVAETIRQAHAKLQEVRRHIPDAGAMAVCIDQAHAAKVAEVIKTETGCTPSIVVSDSDVATDDVNSFRKSDKQWIVSVRQVSEGTDIKRLHVLCYLTNATTELFFRQLIGRVCRTRYQDARSPKAPSGEAADLDLEAFVYLPADPRLIENARNIESAQMRALLELSDKEKREMEPREMQPALSIFAGSEHQGTDRIIVCGKEYAQWQADVIKSMATAGGLPMEKAVALYDAGFGLRSSAQPEPSKPQAQEPEEVLLERARKEGQQLAWRLSKTLDVEVKQVHKVYKPADQLTLKEALAKNADLMRRLSEAKR